MRINVPSPEESKKEKRKKSLRFIKGSIIGIVFFGLCSFGLFWKVVEAFGTFWECFWNVERFGMF